MIKIIDLSKNTVKGVKTVEATFLVDGELVPLRVTQDDQADNYNKIVQMLEKPSLDVDEIQEELYELMSPVAKVKKQIESSFYLSDNLTLEGGVIKFGEYVLEEALSDHMLSLLNEDNTPKDEKLWKSYVKFLDNLHQNVNEDIRKQLFRWIDYENKAGHGFGITDDGCIVGYKGCKGTILEPMSSFEGNAIVDGVEIKGRIPNKVGSVVSMPRSSVQYDPEVGCSVGLHVGTRDYAINWAPILLLVKVNPRDVVSVPYECASQKMRVCEYTVLKVTDASEEHKRYHGEDDDEYEGLEGNYLNVETALDLIDEEIYVEYDNGEKSFEGIVSDVFDDGFDPGIIILNDYDEYKHIKLDRVSYFNTGFIDEDDFDEDYEDEDYDYDEYDDEDDDDEYTYNYDDFLNEDDEDEDDEYNLDVIEDIFLGKNVKVGYDNTKTVSGRFVEIYEDDYSPGIVLMIDNKTSVVINYEKVDFITIDEEKEKQKEKEETPEFIKILSSFFDSLEN